MSAQRTDSPHGDQGQVEYRGVPGFPGYRAGTDGTVWSRRMAKGWRTADVTDPGGRWHQLKPRRRGGNDAWSVDLCRHGKAYHRFVHQIILETFVGPRPPGMVCRHGPLGKYNNSLSNLSWGTQKDNIADKERDGTKVFGVRHHNAKMTPETVRAAREEYANGTPRYILARKYGISNSTMHAILLRQTWREVG